MRNGNLRNRQRVVWMLACRGLLRRDLCAHCWDSHTWADGCEYARFFQPSALIAGLMDLAGSAS